MKNLNKILALIAVAIVGVIIVLAILPPDDSESAKEPKVKTAEETGNATTEAGPTSSPSLRPSDLTDRSTSVSTQIASPNTRVAPIKPIAAEEPTTTTAVAEEKPAGPLRSENELRVAIFSNDENARDAALNELAQLLERGEGKKLLEEMIQSGDADNNEEVIALMPNLPEEERLPLIDLALDSASPEFRAEALDLLRDVVGFDVNDLLIKGMKDTDPDVIEATGDLLVYFDDHPIYEAAWEGLTHENLEVRENAFGYFEDSHTGESIAYLIEALRMQNPYPEISPLLVGDALRFITDADHIETNDYESWVEWFQQFGQEWIAENDPPDEEPPPAAGDGTNTGA